ncbi:MAG: MaoC family dehydratase N-terminal domain-containing protein [Rhodospirillales bacterium]|nr:MaoC family dehydratase N-terminal domain-containing protein [Rhodospirillales bacterium]
MSGAISLADWIGRGETADDILAPGPALALWALLDHPPPVEPPTHLPPLGHWLYGWNRPRQSDLGADGHERLGRFLPPVDLPRRMWAGSRVVFHRPLAIGGPLRRQSTIADIAAKEGRSGRLVFVTVRHRLFDRAADPAIEETQDIVYRGPAKPGDAPAPLAPPAGADWRRIVTPDPVLLFRYSALTFNAHRIHIDRAYARQVEGYPGLVVQGPLTATLLLDLFLRQRPGLAVREFSFRGLAPLFEGQAIALGGKAKPAGADLWALSADGRLAMTAEARI